MPPSQRCTFKSGSEIHRCINPVGELPSRSGVVVGTLLQNCWFGPDTEDSDVISCVAPGSDLAEGQFYELDLKDFIDDTVEFGVRPSNLCLSSAVAGLRIWGGAEGARITSFHAAVP